ncbi:MAG: DNA polymerase IV [Verrucomicrobiota bacterium]
MINDADHERIIFHLDMDAFFAAVEQRDHPEYRGRPVVVGAPPDRRGVVSTASYEARRYGVHSALPSRTARERCPHAVFLPVRMEHYSAVSRAVMGILHNFTPFVEKVSIDEAFMDLRGQGVSYRQSKMTAEKLKEQIYQTTGLTASVGIAPNKFLAKLASDMDKPDGLTKVPQSPEEVREFLAPLAVNKLWGVGKATDEQLRKFRIRTIGDLQLYSEDTLQRFLGNRLGSHLFQLSRGLDNRPVVTEHEEKSISNEHTFPQDIIDERILKQALVKLTEKVGYRLRKSGKIASTAIIKIRYEDFSTITRQQRLEPPTNTDRLLVTSALQLWEKEKRGRPVRLIGFGTTNLLDRDSWSYQPSLFSEEEHLPEDEALDNAVDELRGRYGEDIIRRRL